MTPGPTARFQLAANGLPPPLAVPWPSDIYIADADGTVVDTLTDWSRIGVTAREPSQLFAGVGAMDGFGLTSAILFGIDANGADIDPATLTTATVHLLDPTTNTVVPSIAGWDRIAKVIAVLPQATLAPGHRYVAVLTTGVATTTGERVATAPELAAIVGGATDGAAASYGVAIADAGRQNIAAADVLAITTFTTTTHHRKLRAIRDRLAGGVYGPSPTFVTSGLTAPMRATRFGRTAHAGWTATLDEWLGAAPQNADGDLPGYPVDGEAGAPGWAHDAIGAIVSGAMVSPQFGRPFASTGALDDGTIAYDAMGHAVKASDAMVPVTVVLPATPPPATGYPVMIVQHGLGGDRSIAVAIGNELARKGIAAIAIDAIHHGLRVPGIPDDSSFAPGTYAGPDGFPDRSDPTALVVLVGGLRNGIRAQASFWQLALDLVQLRRLVGSIDLDYAADEFNGVAPTLDATKVGVVGWSMGGLATMELAGIEPGDSLDPVVVISPPGVLARTVNESPDYGTQLSLLVSVAGLDLQSVEAAEYSAVLQLLQSLLDPTDSTVFAPDAAAEHNLWHISAQYDEAAPPATADRIARAMGATQITPSLRTVAGVTQSASPLSAPAAGRIVATYEVAPGDHAHAFARYGVLQYEPPYVRADGQRYIELPAPVRIRHAIIGEQRAIADFATSTWAGAPQIRVTGADRPGLAPVADADDDGFCDDVELAAGTSMFSATSTPPGPPGCEHDVGFPR